VLKPEAPPPTIAILNFVGSKDSEEKHRTKFHRVWIESEYFNIYMDVGA
jgi:hypothetical protein